MNELRFRELSDQDIFSIQNGGVGVLPTDTVYGLGTQASNQEFTTKLYKLKQRERKPGTIIASSTEQILEMGVELAYIDMASTYWPGPVSVIIPAGEHLAYLHQGVGGLAFRVTDDVELNRLLDITGPLLTSSANPPGKPVANTIDEVREYFGDELDFYIDGGDLSDGVASTVIAVSDAGVKILRQGSADSAVLISATEPSQA